MKNIIFDLGNVLVKVNFEKFKSGLLSEGISRAKFNKLFTEKILRDKLESGEISAEKFVKYVTDKLDNKITAKRFIHHFNSMFTENRQMKKILSQLRSKQVYKLILLSNTNSIHFNYIRRRFSYINLFHNFALSYELRMLKPDTRIYNKIAVLYNLRPDESLFIDDLEENCLAAASTGMKIIHYTGVNRFIANFNAVLNS